jgi:hypothetical protein
VADLGATEAALLVVVPVTNTVSMSSSFRSCMREVAKKPHVPEQGLKRFHAARASAGHMLPDRVW